MIQNDSFNETIKKYVTDINSDTFHRFISWDNCNKVFSSNPKVENLDLHLAFYLASWGMYRGSSGLLQLNHKVHEEAVEIILKEEHQRLRCDSTKEVSRADIAAIMKLKNDLADYYGSKEYLRGKEKKKVSPTDTLLSKIMLGTLGCVPAYDRYFLVGLNAKIKGHSVFNEDSLNALFDFIEKHRKEIEEAQEHIKKETDKHYPFMKIVDMYFWQIGYDIELEKEKGKKGK